MATARELLEQADALMRRNRDRVPGDIPVLVDAVPTPAPDPAGQKSAPVAPPSGRSTAPAAIDIPVLTDIVDAPVVAVPGVKEQAPIVTPGFEGDPSNWLVMDTIDPSLHSITDAASDTLSTASYSSKAAGSASTPPPAHSAPRPVARPTVADEDLPFVWDDPPEEPPAPLAGQPSMAGGHSPQRVETRDAAQAEPALPDRSRDATTELRADAWLDEGASSDAHGTMESDRRPSLATSAESKGFAASFASAPAEGRSHLDARFKHDRSPGDELQASAAHEAEAAASVASSSQEDDSALELAAVEAAAGPASDASATQAATQAPGPAGNDDARWQALSEQISMQVLQRVDLFTDEGLRDQLAGRLQPIMARASEELVATITGHVGQLLRTYVAEAIEREIAAWRRDQP